MFSFQEILDIAIRIEKNGEVVGDSTCKRIEFLISEHLEIIGKDDSGWDTLYLDPNDGRYWEHTYPKSHMHGGGTPALIHISEEEAKKKYYKYFKP